MLTKFLTGHTTPETAYVVEDYPYGFTLRCKIRYWIETKTSYGQRLCSQTTNPKKDYEVWNKPKCGTYHPALVMGLDEKNHVTTTALSLYGGREGLDQWVASIPPEVLTDYHKTLINLLQRRG